MQIKKSLLYVMLFISTFTFAQFAPGDNNNTGNLEDNDVPIDNWIILLAIVAITLFVIQLKRKKELV